MANAACARYGCLTGRASKADRRGKGVIFVTHEQLIAAVHDNARAIEENAHRVLRLEKRQDDLDRLVTSVAQLATKQDRMERDLGEIRRDVRALTLVPARRWESVIEKALLTAVAGIVGYLLVRIGIG